MPKITVEKTENRGGTFYNVTIGGVTILGCQRKTGCSDKGPYDFISCPQRKYTHNGTDKWAAIVKFDKETADAVLHAVVELEGGTMPGENTGLRPF